MLLMTLTLAVASLVAAIDSAHSPSIPEPILSLKSLSPLIEETFNLNPSDALSQQVKTQKSQQPDIPSSSNESAEGFPGLDPAVSMIEPQIGDIVFSSNLSITELLQTDETQPNSDLRLLDTVSGQTIEWVQFTVWKLPDGDNDAAECPYEEEEDMEQLDRDNDYSEEL